jgi:hypothetical protein
MSCLKEKSSGGENEEFEAEAIRNSSKTSLTYTLKVRVV